MLRVSNKLTKEKLLAHIVNSIEPKRMGWFQYDGKIKTEKDVKDYFNSTSNEFWKKQETYVDYCYGRGIKINFNTFPEIDPREFDEMHGKNKLKNIIDLLENDNYKHEYNIPPKKITDELDKIKSDIEKEWIDSFKK